MGDVNLEIKLHNVKEKTDKINIDNATDGQVLTYDSDTDTFKPENGGSGTSFITSVSDNFTVSEGELELSTDVTAKLSNITNENLLDNPFFTVNQRGQSSYTNLSAEYSVDRWKSWWKETVSVASDHITITEGANGVNFAQKSGDKYNALIGKTVTLSIKYKTTSNHFTMTVGWNNDTQIIPQSSNVTIFSHTFVIQNDTEQRLATISSGVSSAESIDIYAIKVELGTVSTLANDIAPNTELETIKCQSSTADSTDTYANKSVTKELSELDNSLTTTTNNLSPILDHFEVYNQTSSSYATSKTQLHYSTYMVCVWIDDLGGVLLSAYSTINAVYWSVIQAPYNWDKTAIESKITLTMDSDYHLKVSKTDTSTQNVRISYIIR